MYIRQRKKVQRIRLQGAALCIILSREFEVSPNSKVQNESDLEKGYV